METILISLIRIFRLGPDVSLNGSPTVSPVMVALCVSEPFPPKCPCSTYFFALSQAPPEFAIKIANTNPVDNPPHNKPMTEHQMANCSGWWLVVITDPDVTVWIKRSKISCLLVLEGWFRLYFEAACSQRSIFSLLLSRKSMSSNPFNRQLFLYGLMSNCSERPVSLLVIRCSSRLTVNVMDKIES